MPLVQINADFGRVATALERIALAIEWHLAMAIDPSFQARLRAGWKGEDGPPRLVVEPRSSAVQGPRVTAPTDADLWEAEQEKLRRRGLA